MYIASQPRGDVFGAALAKYWGTVYRDVINTGHSPHFFDGRQAVEERLVSLVGSFPVESKPTPDLPPDPKRKSHA